MFAFKIGLVHVGRKPIKIVKKMLLMWLKMWLVELGMLLIAYWSFWYLFCMCLCIELGIRTYHPDFEKKKGNMWCLYLWPNKGKAESFIYGS
jgi:hypothetical protein